jgi:hypothetical protein
MGGKLTFYSLVVRVNQHDRAGAGTILDFPVQNSLRKSWWRISTILGIPQQ